MNIVIEAEKCIGCGTCPLAPKSFKMNDETNKAEVINPPEMMNRQSKWRLTAVRLRRLRLNNMSEIITTYEIREPNIPIPMERIKFYEEQVKTFKKTGQVGRWNSCFVVYTRR